MSNSEKKRTGHRTSKDSSPPPITNQSKGVGRLSRLTRVLETASRMQQEAEAVRLQFVTILEEYPFRIDEGLFERFSETRTGYNQLPRDLGSPLHVEARKQNMEIGAADFQSLRKAMDMLAKRLEPKGVKCGAWLLPDIAVPALMEVCANPGKEHRSLMTRYTKAAARVAGADLVGVAAFDPHWIYSQQQLNPYMAQEPLTKDIQIEDAAEPEETDRALIIPSDASSVVVCAFGMEVPLDSTASLMLTRGWLSGSHLRAGIAALTVAEFIRKQGYWAIPDTNRLGANVPMAVLAGIGETGRNGLLTTPELGSNLRLSKVITNMPLDHDKPISFGVQEYCATCRRCVEACPARTITEGPQSWSGTNECNNHGTFKWYNDYKKCISHWLKNGVSCANCIVTCPFTKNMGRELNLFERGLES